MKRSVCIIASAFVMLGLGACGEAPGVADSFSADFTANVNDTDCAGRITVSGGETLITLTAPRAAEGMSFDYSAEGLSIGFAGMKTLTAADLIPPKALPSVLNETLTYLDGATYRESGENGDVFALPTPYGEALITARGGLPVSLSDPYSGLEVTFENAEAPFPRGEGS